MIRLVSMANAFKDIIAQLEKQRASIDRALAALKEVDDTEAVSAPRSLAPKSKSKGKRPVSAESRARMAEAQKRIWAAKRAAQKAAVKKVSRKRSVQKATSKEG